MNRDHARRFAGCWSGLAVLLHRNVASERRLAPRLMPSRAAPARNLHRQPVLRCRPGTSMR